MRTGADISHHQASFDPARYAASGEDFLIHKATESGSYTDPTFAARWQAAGAVGLSRGAYHFARPGSGPVDAQADHFVAVVRAAGWRAGDAWALDLEDSGGLGPAALVAWADRWCARARAALGGRGLFYTGVAFVLQALGDPGRIPGGCLGWIARYRSDSPWAAPYRRPGGWPLVPDVWQCTNGEAGCIHDVASVGRCDWNKATDAAFAALFAGGDDMPLTETEIDRIADVVDSRVKARLDAAVSLLYRGDRTEPDMHPANLEQVRKDIAAIDAAAFAATLTDAQIEQLAALVAAKLEIAGHPAYEGEALISIRPKEATP